MHAGWGGRKPLDCARPLFIHPLELARAVHVSVDGRQNHPRQQAEGVRLGLSQGAGGSDGCVDDGQNKQEGATENGAGEIVEVLFGMVSDQSFAT